MNDPLLFRRFHLHGLSFSVRGEQNISFPIIRNRLEETKYTWTLHNIPNAKLNETEALQLYIPRIDSNVFFFQSLAFFRCMSTSSTKFDGNKSTLVFTYARWTNDIENIEMRTFNFILFHFKSVQLKQTTSKSIESIH